MIEIPNNTRHEEMMDFKKFAQSFKHLMFSEDKVFIEGKYRSKGSRKIESGDNFWANVVHKSGKPVSASLIYRTYLEWFNRTLRPYEREREFVSAKINKQKIKKYND